MAFPTTGQSSLVVYAILSLTTNSLTRVLFGQFFFDYGVVLMIGQMATGLIILEISRTFRWVDIAPYTIERGKAVFLPSLLYVVHSFVTSSLVHAYDAPTFTILKRYVPLAILILGNYVSTNAVRPTISLIGSVAVVVVGSIVAGYTDFYLDARSVLFGLVILGLQSAYLTFIQRAWSTRQFSILDLIYLNTFNCLILFLIIDLAFEESRDAFTYALTSATYLFWLAFVSALFVGALLHWAIFYCVIKNSALTTSIVGSMKSILHLLIGRELFSNIYGPPLGFFNYVGLLISIVGCILYAVVLRNSRR